MNTIKQRAHQYAVAHQHKADGISLMRAYVAGAQSERKRTKVFIKLCAMIIIANSVIRVTRNKFTM